MRAIATLSAALGACWIALTAMTAAPNDLTSRRSLEADVLARINYARQHPREYARELRAYRAYIRRDGILFLPGDPNGVYTREGVAAVDEAIDFLENQAPLPALTEGQILALAARDHADEQGSMGSEGHVSRDGSGPGQRVARRGGDRYVAESISYGFADAGAVVRQLIIDDGVPSRGHRNLLFGSDFRYAGVGCAEHRRLRHLCVVDLSATANGAPMIPAGAQARGARAFTYRGN
ncbi:MAG: CAP domain-containing protein [Sphingomonas sp.]